jgi:uncharacterized protein (DUF924 family)
VKPVTEIASPQSVVAFWRDAGPERWFKKDTAFDAEIRARFLGTYEEGAAGRLADWEKTAEGALALTILLDQFPRNMFRDDPRAFAADPLACKVAAKALDRGFDRQAKGELKHFFYMPFMHAEAVAEQERCVELFRQMGNNDGLKYAQIHADIVRRFGRFPHRNKALGRANTPEEQAFLDSGGFSG